MARPKKNPDFAKLTCAACSKEFDVKWQKRNKQRFCSKACAVNDPIIKEKNRTGVKAAFQEKYGGHPMSVNDATKENFKASMVEKYGVEYAPQMEDFSDKVKATKLERHGSETYNNIEQMKETMLKKYGVDNFRKTKEYETKYKETCLKKYGVVHSSQAITRKEDIASSTFKQSHKLAMFKKFCQSDKFKNFEPQFNMDEYNGIAVKYNKPYAFKCKRCDGVHSYDLTRQHLRCPKCDSNVSTFQSHVADYIKSILPNEPVVLNNRAVLTPLELDIYIPNKNVAIETNGLYWHSEISGNKNKNYHINKTKLCAAKGIRLIHVYENEWNHSQQIVKTILKNIFCEKPPVNADVSVREITPKEKCNFLESNHLNGNDAAMVRIGLFEKNTLVGVMTFVKSKIKNDTDWELSRFCSIKGNPAQLFNYFVKQYKPNSVVAYCDRRYFTGESYMKMGFSFVKHNEPLYDYIIDAYDTVESKNNWQKSKLKKKLLSFDPNLSEWENMKNNGFDRIWDCGHSKWIFKKPTYDI